MYHEAVANCFQSISPDEAWLGPVHAQLNIKLLICRSGCAKSVQEQVWSYELAQLHDNARPHFYPTSPTRT